jgi:hypothetical protein
LNARLILIATALLASCKLPVGECLFRCDQNGRCAVGVCGGDQFCHQDQDLNHCASNGPSPNDGGLPDGGIVKGGPFNYVFVTSKTYVPGMLGGLVAADTECQKLADAVGLTGHFRAWLSTSTVDAPGRLTTPSGGPARGFIRPDGQPFTDTIARLIGNGQIFYPARLDESGRDLVDAFETSMFFVPVATGTNNLGARTPDTAGDWTSTTARFTAGDAVATTHDWTLKFSVDATQPAHLYCFGTDFDQPLTLTPLTTKRSAFVSSGTFAAASGLAAADAQCQSEAQAASLPGSYRALLATTALAATDPSRLDLSGAPWVRIDGAPWVTTAADLAAGHVLTSLNVEAQGNYGGYLPVWTGAVDPKTKSAAFPAKQSCTDWSSNAASDLALAGLGAYSNSMFWNAVGNARPCNDNQNHLYCLER